MKKRLKTRTFSNKPRTQPKSDAWTKSPPRASRFCAGGPKKATIKIAPKVLRHKRSTDARGCPTLGSEIDAPAGQGVTRWRALRNCYFLTAHITAISTARREGSAD